MVKDFLLNNGFVFEQKLDYFNECYVSNSNSEHKIVYDSLYNRIGFYFKGEPIEQAFLIKIDYRSFLEWIKNPQPKTKIELAFLQLKPIIDLH